MSDSGRRVVIAILLIVVIMVGGTVGYWLLEPGWSLGESLYMVIITLSTVGFSEVRPLSPSGRVLTGALILTGVAAFGYVAATLSRLIVEGEMRRVLGRRRMERELARLDGHHIVCGYGRVGQEVCEILRSEGVAVAVVDSDAEVTNHAADNGLPAITGDATDEDVLRRAGLERAAGLLLTLSDDADNVYVTLIARDLRPDASVIARSVTAQGERRLYAAGADRVVSPERLGAWRLAQSVVRPTVYEFTEIVAARENLELQLEEQLVDDRSRLVGRTLAETDIRKSFSLIVVAVLDSGRKMLYNPSPDHQISEGSTLILLGRRDDLERFAASI